MPCHFIKDKQAGKVLIPDCIGVSVYNDLDYCTCSKRKKTEVEILSDKIQKLENEINILKTMKKLCQ